MYKVLMWILHNHYMETFDSLRSAIYFLTIGIDEGRCFDVGVLDGASNTMYLWDGSPSYYEKAAEMIKYFNLKDPIIKLWDCNDKDGEIAYSEPPSDILKYVNKEQERTK